jgi:hypothetical protein
MLTGIRKARMGRDVLELDDHQHGRCAADRSGAMTQFAAGFPAILVAAKGQLARSHLDARAIHRLDEPTSGKRDDPLRLRVLVPGADPADGEDGDKRRHPTAQPVALPLRISGRIYRLELKLRHRASCLVTDPFGICP